MTGTALAHAPARALYEIGAALLATSAAWPLAMRPALDLMNSDDHDVAWMHDISPRNKAAAASRVVWLAYEQRARKCRFTAGA